MIFQRQVKAKVNVLIFIYLFTQTIIIIVNQLPSPKLIHLQYIIKYNKNKVSLEVPSQKSLYRK